MSQKRAFFDITCASKDTTTYHRYYCIQKWYLPIYDVKRKKEDREYSLCPILQPYLYICIYAYSDRIYYLTVLLTKDIHIYSGSQNHTKKNNGYKNILL